LAELVLYLSTIFSINLATSIHGHRHNNKSLCVMTPVPVSCQELTQAGFAAAARERRGSGWVSEAAINHKRQQKLDRLHKTTQDLVVAWGLSLVCGLGHLAHVWPGAPAWMHLLHHPVLAAGLSAAALLGAPRQHSSTAAGSPAAWEYQSSEGLSAALSGRPAAEAAQHKLQKYNDSSCMIAIITYNIVVAISSSSSRCSC
jgi:hypothetical protein